MSPSNEQKAFLKTESGKRIDCLFNPKELSINVTASWGQPRRGGDEEEQETIPGVEVPQQYYNGGEPSTMSLSLFFDTTADGSPVTKYTDELIKLTKIDKSLSGFDESLKNGRPPWVTFHWGKFHSFKAVITSLELSYVHFSPTGEPLRATAGVSLRQYQNEADWPRQNPTSGTPKPARSHKVQPGETLDRIAARYYGDATRWRGLAELNGIRDPFRLKPGLLIDVPKLES